MEFNNEYSSNGKANLGVTLGAIGVGLGILNGSNGCGNGVLGGLFNGNGNGCCSDDHYVNRYEAAQNSRIATLETELKLRDANIYTDSKIADVYERLNTKISGVEAQICQQAVLNATTNSTLGCIANQVAQLQALTKVIIPATNICPEPMAKYNSWVAPVTTTTGA